MGMLFFIGIKQVILFLLTPNPAGALNRWYTHNQGLPGRIIVYRDGVGDGQLRTLIEYEVPQLLSSVTEASSNTRYQISILPPLPVLAYSSQLLKLLYASISFFFPMQLSFTAFLHYASTTDTRLEGSWDGIM